MICILGGNEPYMIDWKIKEYTSNLTASELNLYKAEALTEEVYDFLLGYPIADVYRVAVVTISHLKDLERNRFFKAFRNTNSTNWLILRIREYDARTAFYKELNKAGFIKLYNKTEYYHQLAPFLKRIAAAKKAFFAEGVIDAMLNRCNYLENEEMNIYTLQGMVNNMASISDTIDVPLMESIVPKFDKDDTFGVAKMIATKNISGLRIQAELLKGDEIRCLSALLREYRIAYKAKYYPLSEIGVKYGVFLKMDKAYLINGIEIITQAISRYKKGTISKEHCLLDTFLRLTYPKKQTEVETYAKK